MKRRLRAWWNAARAELGQETQPVDTVVRLIILERGIRGGLLLVLGAALLANSQQIMAAGRDWVADLDLNPGRGFFSNLLITVLRPIGLLPPRTVHWIALGTVAFAALELTEAVGLARRRRWAEYLTVMAGTIGIPFELEAVRHHVTVLRVSFLLINIAIVLYLAWHKHLFGLQGGRATEKVSESMRGRAGSRRR